MFNIQCEDIQFRFSNTKSSMLYNLVTVGEALWVILDELLDNTTVKEVVNRNFKVHVMGLSRLSGDCMCPP